MATPNTEACRRYRERNRELLAARASAYKAANREKVLAAKADYRRRNAETLRVEALARYHAKGEARVEANREYRAANRAKEAARKRRPESLASCNASKVRRRSRQPPWISSADCAAFYAMAKRVSRCLGIAHHVDHITPLNGATVSGLHVPGNLRVVPAVINLRKGNRLGNA